MLTFLFIGTNRFPNQPDPPIQPSKVFAVKRIRSLFGCPHWEKKWMRELGLIVRKIIFLFFSELFNRAISYQNTILQLENSKLSQE